MVENWSYGCHFLRATFILRIAYSCLESFKSYKALKLAILEKMAKKFNIFALQGAPLGEPPNPYIFGKHPLFLLTRSTRIYRFRDNQ